MRPSNKSRSRNKPGSNGSQHNNNNNNQRRSMGNVINRVFESAGPDGKVRGTPQQIIDKYQALARDAQVSGDRVAAESYLQHSEHYSRILGEAQRQQNDQRFGSDRDDAVRADGGRDDGARDDGGHDTGGRDAGGRDDGARNDSAREDGLRDDAGRDDDARVGAGHDTVRRDDARRDRDNDSGRHEQGRPFSGQDRQNQQARHQPMVQSFAPAGLTTIDPTDDDDLSGPIDTPEGSRGRSREAAPASRAEATSPELARNGSAHGTPETPSVEPAKRPRTRRRAKADIDTADPLPFQAD